MRIPPFAWILFSCLAIVSTTAKANPSSLELLKSAEQAYNQGNFAEAEKSYSTLLGNSDISKTNQASLYYNLANTEFKLGNKGAAFAWLLRAEKITPLDGDISQNILFVRSQLDPEAAGVQPSGIYFAFVPEFLRTYKSLFLALAFLLLTLQLLSVWRKNSHSHSAILLYSGFGVSLLAFLLLSLENTSTLGVIVKDPVVLRSGPSASFSELSTLHQGSLVRVSDQADQWYKVSFTTAGNRSRELVGWLEQGALLRLSSF